MENSEPRPSPERGLSIITALYNCLEMTREYLFTIESTLAGTGEPWEIILVDDGSTDGTRDFLAELKSPYRVVLQEENYGYAASNNRGAKLARYDKLAFLNNDLIMQPGWLEPMLAGLETLPGAGIIGNVQIDPRTGLIDHAGVFFDYQGLPAHALKGRKRLRRRQAYREWNAVTAACMLVRREVFLAAGGFDEAYHNGTEDIDLCVRLRLDGYRHYVANRSRIWHHVSSSPGRTDNDAANMQLFQERWGAVTREWGKREWAREYLCRYARRWWRYNFQKFWRAVFILAFQRRIAKVEKSH